MSRFKDQESNLFDQAVDRADKKAVPTSAKIQGMIGHHGAMTGKPLMLSDEVFNLIVQISGYDRVSPTVIFNWLRGLKSYRVQSDGSVLLEFESNFFAERVFQFIAAPLIRRFSTKQIAALVNGKIIRNLERVDILNPIGEVLEK
jgi:hypothetical protein